MDTMKAIGVAKYGGVDNLESRNVPRPGKPTGRDVLVKVQACSVNPIDVKIRAGIYDDAPGIATTQNLTQTACSLHHRLDIKPNENVGILIINGAGGVGSAAIQLARNVLNLPVVVTTASRQETIHFCKEMGATHVINHRKDLVEQIKDLSLSVPTKYAYILASTEQYIHAVAKICAPFGKVCSIVQADVSLYGTDFMSKSMTFAWDWLGSAAYHRTNVEGYHEMFGTLSRLMDERKLVPTLGKRYKLTLAGLKEAHRQIKSKTTIGKVGLGIDEPGQGTPFA
ncbi:hypothetical protein FOC1_g10002898 [Fusarium oxysporum f. sp. cubense race 1]|uniref:Enoyl reductase (ER) domain-containing protein n=1 Tax=Fusarium oxysporum f. sp. cubense (strain race 1) TaxID=1229664 RepID=N4UU73_FUSC1|nr:hypothetical protein FOC1_g10002898 [Fusarium oxysporum f. sp. cubense race 1]